MNLLRFLQPSYRFWVYKFQVVTFSEGNTFLENIPRAMIAHMPRSIVVTKAEEIPMDWSPAGTMVKEEDVYLSHNAKKSIYPLTQRFHYHVKKPLDSDETGCPWIVGYSWFYYIAGVESSDAQSGERFLRHRHCESVRLFIFRRWWIFVHMVRNITYWWCGLHRREPSAIPGYLEAKARKPIGKTAPPQGLCLEEIFFTQERCRSRWSTLVICNVKLMQQYLIRYYRFIGQKYIVILNIIIGRTSEDSTDFIL